MKTVWVYGAEGLHQFSKAANLAAFVEMWPNAIYFESQSSTHVESDGGVRVLIQHCEYPGCDEYLGVNYPSDRCHDHKEGWVST